MYHNVIIQILTSEDQQTNEKQTNEKQTLLLDNYGKVVLHKV